MKKEIPAHIQESLDNVMALYDLYLSGNLNLKALDPIAVLDLEKDFKLADNYLDYVKHRGLAALRESLVSSLLEE